MLKDFLDSLQQKMIETAIPKLVEVNPQKLLAYRDENGKVEFREPDPAPRNHQAKDLETIVSIAKRFEAMTVDSGQAKPAVWFSRAGLIVLINDDDRNDRTLMPLALSEPLRKLMELERTQAHMNQRDLLFMLRTVFKNCLGKCPNLIDVLRKIKFSIQQGGESEINRGRSSVGKSATAELLGQGTLPEYVVIDVPIFDGVFPNLRGNIECLLEPNEQSQSFQLFPLPGEVERAIAGAEASIGTVLTANLEEAGVPVYYGTP